MTAIYGFASPRHSVGALGADELKHPQNTKADKVDVLGDRYAIAQCGSNASEAAIGAMAHLDDRDLSGRPWYESVSVLSQSLCDATRAFVRIWNGKALDDSPITLFVLDCREYKLYRIELGKPTSLASRPQLIELDAELLHFLCVKNGPPPERLDEAILANPREAIESRIRRWASQVPQIGSPGAVATVIAGRVLLTSAVRTPIEFIENWYV